MIRHSIATIRAAVLAAFFMPALGGCATLEQLLGAYGGEGGLELIRKAAEGADKIEDATIGNAVKVVPFYCNNLPGAARTVFRTRVNSRAEIGGNQIAIWCVGDAPIVLGPRRRMWSIVKIVAGLIGLGEWLSRRLDKWEARKAERVKAERDALEQQNEALHDQLEKAVHRRPGDSDDRLRDGTF